MEIDALNLLSREHLKIRFSSEVFGSIGLARKCFPGQWVASSRGVCFEIVEELKTRSIISDGLRWYRFRARSMGSFFLKFKLSQSIIDRVVEINPDLVCHGLEEIVSENLFPFDFKRTRRPFVAVEARGARVNYVFIEYYADTGKVGLYCGQNDKGLGGFMFVSNLQKFNNY